MLLSYSFKKKKFMYKNRGINLTQKGRDYFDLFKIALAGVFVVIVFLILMVFLFLAAGMLYQPPGY